MQPLRIALRRIDCRTADARAELRALRRLLSPDGSVVSERGRALTLKVFGEALSPLQSVERICKAVKARGFAAAQEFSIAFDGYSLTPANLKVGADELAAAHGTARPGLLEAVGKARRNVLAYQSAILHQDQEVNQPNGARIRHRHRPLRRVGVCVPGGAAAYPSTLLMTVVPAQAAGVKEIAVIAPPTAYGSLNAEILAVCHELGVEEVYRLGGAHGVAALAYGIDGLPRVDMIVGPGNLFVALAKKHVFGEVGIDAIAGPSEVIVLADESARPEFVAADLIAQAEHSPGASLLITWHEPLLAAVAADLEKQLAAQSRGELARAALEQFGALILARDEAEAIDLTNALAPEHLHLQTASAEAHAERCPNAGAIFVGPHTPVALGDYVAGPSHVLPTGGTARFASGLSANDFLRRTAVIRYDEAALRADFPALEFLAEAEGLPGHAASARLRAR